MAEFPALPLWTDAYLGDTVHLTTIKHGAYLLLLMTAWRARSHDLPDDDRMLARYCRLTVGQWRRIRPTLEPFWMVANGRWSNRRLLDELDAVRQARAQRSDAGRASALKRKHRGSTGVPTKLQREGNTLPIPIVGKELVGNTELRSEESSLNVRVGWRKRKSPARSHANGAGLDAGFDEWYGGYPLKQKPADALKAWRQARRGDVLKPAPTVAELMAARDRYIATKPPDYAWAYPASWLRAGRWADEAEPTGDERAEATFQRLMGGDGDDDRA